MPTRIDPSQVFNMMKSSASIVEAADLQALLDELVRTAVETTGARYGALGVLGEHGQLAEFRHQGMDPKTVAEIGHLPVGKGVLGTLIRKAEALIVDEITEHPDSIGFPPGHPKMGPFLGVPVMAGDRVFGNLYLTDKPGGFNEDDLIVVSGLAVLAGTAVESARMRKKLGELALVDDRERIARDLHDSIIQDLFGVGLSLQSLAMRLTGQDETMLNDTVDQIDSIIVRLRGLIFGLNRPGKAPGTFRDSIDGMLADLSKPFDVSIRLNIDAEDPGDPELANHIRHIVKETVSNSLRHSGAKNITVDVERYEDRMIMVVTDDGIGFDPATVKRGLGLGNLDDRVRRLGGSVSIRSGADKGTVVEVTILL